MPEESQEDMQQRPTGWNQTEAATEDSSSVHEAHA